MSGDIHCTNRLSFCKTLEGCFSVSTSELFTWVLFQIGENSGVMGILEIFFILGLICPIFMVGFNKQSVEFWIYVKLRVYT